MKILVAEDEVNIAESYKLMLEFKGHEVTLTGDGEKCLDVYMRSLSASPPASLFDLVILDYRMPKKDGVQVAQEILGTVPGQRILLATAFVHDLSISRLQEIPATKSVELIQKPFDFDNFLNMVHNHGTVIQEPKVESSSLGDDGVGSLGGKHKANPASAKVASGLSFSIFQMPLGNFFGIQVQTNLLSKADDKSNLDYNKCEDQFICQSENELMRTMF